MAITESFIIKVREKDVDTAWKKVKANPTAFKGGELLAQKDKIVVFKDLRNRPIGQLLDGIHDLLNDDPRFEDPANSPAGCFQIKAEEFLFFGVSYKDNKKPIVSKLSKYEPKIPWIEQGMSSQELPEETKELLKTNWRIEFSTNELYEVNFGGLLVVIYFTEKYFKNRVSHTVSMSLPGNDGTQVWSPLALEDKEKLDKMASEIEAEEYLSLSRSDFSKISEMMDALLQAEVEAEMRTGKDPERKTEKLTSPSRGSSVESSTVSDCSHSKTKSKKQNLRTKTKFGYFLLILITAESIIRLIVSFFSKKPIFEFASSPQWEQYLMFAIASYLVICL